MFLIYCFILLISIFNSGLCIPKKYEGNNTAGGFLPSSGTFYRPDQSTVDLSTAQPLNGRALTASQRSSNESESASERIQRLGFTGYGGAGYPGTGTAITPGLYAPLKIDLGGVVLGTLIGLGAVLILPKLAHAFSYGGYDHGYGGGYARSSDSSLTELMSNFETALEKYNIDSSSCMQRLMCSTVQNARTNMASGNPTSVDQWVEILTTNTLFSSMLDGTAIKEAVDAGWGTDANACNNYYPKCTINKQKILQMVSSILPSS